MIVPPRIAIALGLLFSTATCFSADDRHGGSPSSGEAAPRRLQPIDLSGFHSGIHHWRRIKDESRFIQAEPAQPAYSPEQVFEIVDNILLFQRADGGWPKDYDMTAVLTDAQRAKIKETHHRSDSSYDNGNIHSQVAYLAGAYSQYPEPTWRQACERGIDFMIRSQTESGGFPQRFPKATGFHAHITFNDGVMMGIVRVLDQCAAGQPHFEWLDENRRNLARRSVERAIECILACQIRHEGKRTGWCQQHDQLTFEARPARSFELASLCPQETTDITRFLMSRPSPSSEIIAAVHGAIDWLRAVELRATRLDRVTAKVEHFLRHSADFDIVVVNDPQAPPLWARHYEIGTNRPIFAGRDGIKKYALAEIERERRTGTAWYGGWPRTLLEQEWPQWPYAQ